MDKYVGKRLDGRYEITELIGSGGMANVYKANDVLEGIVVAVKILKDEFLKNSDFLRRFKNESKAIALLSHPNIVRVVDVSFGDRIQYIVMEYISGITLKEYIEQQGVLTWKEAVHFTVQVLRALQHAHDNGIVHRDVKPQNIMLLQDGTIKVMDFGIARFARGDSKTMTDKAIGSVHYISPEQARGGEIDEKTDIYSVGVMVFEMLTGQLPFEADNAVSVAIMQMQAPLRKPRDINETIPEGLEEITVRAMQKDPAKRYQSAAEMLRDIDEFKRNPSIVFEYKYFGDDGATKYFDTVEKEIAEGEEEEVTEKKSHMIPILAGVAGAFVLVSAIVCIIIFGFSDMFNKVPEVDVPKLIGQVYDDAIEEKEYKEQFKIELENTAFSDEYEAGYIIEQNPKAGSKIKRGQTIKVVVSSGMSKVDVPDVTNRTEAEATDLLRKAGFEVEVAREFNSTVAKGSVTRTDPIIGSQVAQGETIKIFVSLGPSNSPAIVPNLLSFTVEKARSMLTDRKLQCIVVEIDSAETKGTVLSQNPPKDTQLNEGDSVTIEVSNGKAPSSTLNFTASIPSNASQYYDTFTFTVIIDGAVQNSLTKDIYLPAASSFKFSLTGSGSETHDVRVMVAPKGSSEKSKLLVQYSIQYDIKGITTVSSNPSVFLSFTPPSSSSDSLSSSSEEDNP